MNTEVPEYDPIFFDSDFLESLDTIEKRAAYYWQHSKEYYGKGLSVSVERVMRATCHVACIVHSDTSRFRFIDLERRIVHNGHKAKRRRKSGGGNVVQFPAEKCTR